MTNLESREQAIDRLLAKQAIYDVLCRYCHGIDRCDIEVLQSAYWPDATDTHGTFNGNAWEFAEYIVANMRSGLKRSMQKIGNAYIELDPDGEHARGETYVLAYLQADGPDGLQDRIVAGRYLDRFERRGGEWRILDRLYVLDWNQNSRSTAQWDTGLYASLRTRGARSPEDPWDLGLPRPRA